MNRGIYHLEETYWNQSHIRWRYPVKQSFTGWLWETFASTNSHVFVSLCHFSLQLSRKGFEISNSDESLNYNLPSFGYF